MRTGTTARIAIKPDGSYRGFSAAASFASPCDNPCPAGRPTGKSPCPGVVGLPINHSRPLTVILKSSVLMEDSGPRHVRLTRANEGGIRLSDGLAPGDYYLTTLRWEGFFGDSSVVTSGAVRPVSSAARPGCPADSLGKVTPWPFSRA